MLIHFLDILNVQEERIKHITLFPNRLYPNTLCFFKATRELRIISSLTRQGASFDDGVSVVQPVALAS